MAVSLKCLDINERASLLKNKLRLQAECRRQIWSSMKRTRRDLLLNQRRNIDQYDLYEEESECSFEEEWDEELEQELKAIKVSLESRRLRWKVYQTYFEKFALLIMSHMPPPSEEVLQLIFQGIDRLVNKSVSLYCLMLLAEASPNLRLTEPRWLALCSLISTGHNKDVVEKATSLVAMLLAGHSEDQFLRLAVMSVGQYLQAAQPLSSISSAIRSNILQIVTMAAQRNVNYNALTREVFCAYLLDLSSAELALYSLDDFLATDEPFKLELANEERFLNFLLETMARKKSAQLAKLLLSIYEPTFLASQGISSLVALAFSPLSIYADVLSLELVYALGLMGQLIDCLHSNEDMLLRFHDWLNDNDSTVAFALSTIVPCFPLVPALVRVLRLSVAIAENERKILKAAQCLLRCFRVAGLNSEPAKLLKRQLESVEGMERIEDLWAHAPTSIYKACGSICQFYPEKNYGREEKPKKDKSKQSLSPQALTANDWDE